MAEYRTGSHWGRTIIRVGNQPADATGKRPDDQLVGTMDDPALAERVCALLNADERAHFERLLEASSLGTPEANALIASVPEEVGAAIVQRSKRLGQCTCGHDGLDTMFHLGNCPLAEAWRSQRRKSVIHLCPDDSGVSSCCGMTPFELPRTDRITEDRGAATCQGLTSQERA